MSRKNQLKPVDEAEEHVRNNAIGYKVVLFVPQSSNRDNATFVSFDKALDYAESSLENYEYRCAMIYAFDKIEKYILHGTLRRNQDYKKCLVKS